MEELEIKGDHTGTNWNSFCREVVIFGAYQTNLKISGPGLYVEMDESKIGKRKYHRGHHVNGQWVIGGIERQSGICFIVPIEDVKQENCCVIHQYIKQDSIIVFDCVQYYTNNNIFSRTIPYIWKVANILK